MKNDSMIRVEGGAPAGLPSDGLGELTYGEYSAAVAARRPRASRYWRALLSHAWLILGVTLAVTLVAVVLAAQQPQYYQATARIEVNPESNYVLGSGGGSNQAIYDPFHFSSQLQIIEGPGLLRRVVKGMDLEHNRAFVAPLDGDNPSAWENVRRMFGWSQGLARKDQRDPAPDDLAAFDAAAQAAAVIDDQAEIEKLAPYVSMIRSGLTVSAVKDRRAVVKETRLIDITFTHYDRNVAPKVANAVADAYVALNLEKRTGNSASTGDFLQRRVLDLQGQIRAGEERLINYAKNHQILSLDESQNTVVQRLADLNGRLSLAEHDRIVAEAAYRSATEPGAAAAEVAGADPRTASLEAKLGELRQRREQLRVTYQDEAEEVTEVDRQIDQVTKDLESTRQQAIATLTKTRDTKYREALARERDLRKYFEAQRGMVLAQNEASINYRIIQQEVETNKSLLNGLLQALRENEVVRSGTPNNVALVDRALTPRRPAGPDRLQYVALAALCAFAAAVGFALLRGRSDDSLHTPDDVERGLLLPVLSEIPSLPNRARRALPLPAMLRRRVAASLPDAEPTAAAKEAYMHLRTNVLLAASGQPPGVLLVTSGRPEEGKTTTAINLAKTLAETGARVLLVDADLRNSSLGRVFGIAGERGLSNLLSEPKVDRDLLTEAVKLDGESGLYILSAGTSVGNPATLLCSNRMRQLIAFMRQRFAYIVIDSPPAMLFTDASVLSTFVDAVLLVVRSGQSSQDVAVRTRKLLQERGAQLFGVVLNDAVHPTTTYGYSGRKPQAAAAAAAAGGTSPLSNRSS